MVEEGRRWWRVSKYFCIDLNEQMKNISNEGNLAFWRKITPSHTHTHNSLPEQ